MAYQDWDSTLKVKNSTSQAYKTIVNTDNFIISYIEPLNYDPGNGIGRFTTFITDIDDNQPDPRHDVVLSWAAFNYNPGGDPTIVGQAAFAFKAETYFNQDGTHLMEFHLPELVDDAGLSHRLSSIYVHRPDGLAYLQSQIQNIAYRVRQNNNDAWMSMESNDTVGVVTVVLNASFGTGGTSGTQTNAANLYLIDGSGNNCLLQQVTGAFRVQQTTGIILTTNLIQLSTQLKFTEGNVFGDNQVYMYANSDTAGKGFNFMDLNGNNFIIRVLNGGVISFVPFNASSLLYIGNTADYADNAAAIAAGLIPTTVYRTGDFLKIVH